MKTRTTTDRWWDIWAALFLIFALMSAATRLYSTQWTTDLERVQYLTLIGGILGLALGQSRFSGRVVRIFATVYTLFFIPWQLGSMQSGADSWSERLYALKWRLIDAGEQFFANREVNDSILFILLMAVLFWLLSITAGYYLTRYGSYWASLIPIGIGILIVNHFDPSNPSWGRTVGVFLFCALLLIGRMTYLRRKAEWLSNGVSQPPETGFDLGRALVVVVIVIFMLSWTVPAIAASSDSARQFWTDITHPWQTFRDRMGDVVSSLRSTVGVVSDMYGDTLSLGTGSDLSDDVIFEVETQTQRPVGARYYWHVRSYDTYDGKWSDASTSLEPYQPSDTDIQKFPWASRQLIEFSFRSYNSFLRDLYTGPAPLYVSVPGKIEYNPVPEGGKDVLFITADPPLKSGKQYMVRSWVSVPTAVELRDSAQEYPDWVRERYLQLPAGFSPRIQDLAKEIIQQSDNPYDKALAITMWLRRNIEYQRVISPAPEGQDPLEWFLFNSKTGFCNYYATAEVLMLRSVGVPARMAVGYAQGEVDEGRDRYIVRQSDAHAWPEVYFEGYGWVEFEPTVSQAAREFLESEGLGEDIESGANPLLDGNRNLGPDRGDTAGGLDQIGGRLTTESRTGLFVGLALLAGLAAFFVWRRNQLKFDLPTLPVFIEARLTQRGIAAPAWLRNWSRRSMATPLEKAYGSINQGLRLMGQRPELSETPHERAANLSRLVPQTNEPANELLQEYEKGQYSPYPADVNRARQAGVKIRKISWKALVRRLFREG
ncbi:MAG TPA: transglutaminase-like domain-containing protein [Anaerolineaceae bacterium]|nr:transglutaminase-like domain-containing protein [Anaerolineaceae bacterium]